MLHPSQVSRNSWLAPKGWTLPYAYDMFWSASHIRLTCKYIWILGQSALSSTFGSDNDRLTFKAWPLESRKAMSISMHQDDLRGCTQLAISIPDWRKGLTSDRTHDQQTNAYKKARGSWLMSLNIYLMFFIRIVPHTKSKGLLIDVP
jgi:hypothetical protein